MKGAGVLPILHHLAFDRHDVRQHVSMANDDALGLGRGAGGEDDLNHVVARNRDMAGIGPSALQSRSANRQTA